MQTILVLENIRSLHNIGALFRSADGAGSPRLILIGYTATPPRREITKTALGAEESIEWEYFETIEDFFVAKRSPQNIILALEEGYGGQDLYADNLNPTGEMMAYLIVGNEVEWVSEYARSHADKLIYIPMQGDKNSLNVSIAGSVALFDLIHRHS